jgi:hypothetical protein
MRPDGRLLWAGGVPTEGTGPSVSGIIQPPSEWPTRPIRPHLQRRAPGGTRRRQIGTAPPIKLDRLHGPDLAPNYRPLLQVERAAALIHDPGSQRSDSRNLSWSISRSACVPDLHGCRRPRNRSVVWSVGWNDDPPKVVMTPFGVGDECKHGRESQSRATTVERSRRAETHRRSYVTKKAVPHLWISCSTRDERLAIVLLANTIDTISRAVESRGLRRPREMQSPGRH